MGYPSEHSIFMDHAPSLGHCSPILLFVYAGLQSKGCCFTENRPVPLRVNFLPLNPILDFRDFHGNLQPQKFRMKS
jgi:hypothetical protein